MNPLKILVVPDKFKGTLTAQAAAEAIERGWLAARPKDSLEFLPMSDGGEGFGEVMAALLNAKPRFTATVDAAHRPLKARWWWVEKNKTVLIESAQVIGLAQLPLGKFHPFELDTFGLGKLFEAAIQRGAKEILIGIGGSATNDGGFGLACALGWKFLDARGDEIKNWPDLVRLETICKPSLKGFPKVVVAVDVQNPLLGKRGATRVYGVQKGLRHEDLSKAEAALKGLAKVCGGSSTISGAGAAGGLGFGLRCFANGKLVCGFEIFSSNVNLQRRIRKADLVITGEGPIDGQSFMGKGVGEVFGLCSKLHIPCVALAGTIQRANQKFVSHAIVPGLADSKSAKARPSFYLSKLAERVARNWKSGRKQSGRR